MSEDYISTKESAAIIRENRKKIKALQKERKALGANAQFCSLQNKDNLVEFENLKTYFFTDIGCVKAVDGITFNIPKGKTIGIVGESGCGKSITSLSLMRLLQEPQGQITGGKIRYASCDTVYDITKATEETMRHLRGNQMAMIFQEPMTSLNPVMRIGSQIDEVMFFHKTDLVVRKILKDTHKETIKSRTIDMLNLVGISNPKGVYNMYPHELSGGMVQRVMISMALVCEPSLIIADEPTTALDVTIQAQILDLLQTIKTKINSSIMLITHDLGVVAQMADFVAVMYAGRIVERGSAEDIFNNPVHPYTLGLMKSKPVLNRSVERLYSIPGQVPNPVRMPDYCYFRDRCERAGEECSKSYPLETQLSETHFTACFKAGKT
ncbi:MAG: ABC transporter ATP-binding protein [Spirochaetaceae bacterium]|jgi:peptide/nickel transport system ATP-binding protein|nr:ABC transporter ATP-binding protein [Spirochaetaceae bacterium]